VFHSTNYAAVQGLVRAGLGVALVPRLAFVPDEGICVLDLGQPPMKRYISAVVRAAERDGPARSLLKILRDVTSKLILAQP
jgi:DNA-binding transcriptional LysR family regulator